jgi:hypothetical protein
MDCPQELIGVDEEEETEAYGLPSSSPSVLEADLVEGSTPRRGMAAPAPTVGLPRALVAAVRGGHAGVRTGCAGG